MKYKIISIAILFLSVCMGIILTGINSTQPENGWKLCPPSEAGMNTQVLEELRSKMHQGTFGKQDGLVIIKDGMLVMEEYGNGYNASRVHTIQSDTKSVTSLLIGIARDQGKIRSIEDHMADYVKGTTIRNLDENKKKIMIGHLLTMTSGFDWDESLIPTGSPDNPVMKMNSSPDWMQTAIDAPMKYAPETAFQYNSGGVIILDEVLKASTGMHADEFAQKNLFSPLGIDTYFWVKQGLFFGRPHTGGGLCLRPRDMAKIGQLILNRGVWDGKRILSEEWLNASLRTWVRNIDLGAVRAGYGFLWWIFPDPEDTAQNIFTCMGYGGQFIFIIPRHDLVVVTTASNYEGKDLDYGADILYNYVLKSLDGGN